MGPKKKQSIEPTRRSTRKVSSVSQPSATTAKEASKKRTIDDPTTTEESPAAARPAPQPKKAKKNLGVGDKLPDITLLDEEGNTVEISGITLEKGIILFAYPKASTPGCTKQVLSCVTRHVFLSSLLFFTQGVSRLIYCLGLWIS